MSERHQYINNLPNRMNKDEFISCFGGVYEHSPWIAEMAWERNFTKRADLGIKLRSIMIRMVILNRFQLI